MSAHPPLFCRNSRGPQVYIQKIWIFIPLGNIEEIRRAQFRHANLRSRCGVIPTHERRDEGVVPGRTLSVESKKAHRGSFVRSQFSSLLILPFQILLFFRAAIPPGTTRTRNGVD